VLEKDFVVNKDKKGDFLYIKKQLVTELWGYSDGKDCYIFSANKYFKLYRAVNSFRFYGAKDLTSVRTIKLNAGLADLINPNSNYSKGQTGSMYTLVKTYLQLDMDDGKIY
jgi:hypothetical protein